MHLFGFLLSSNSSLLEDIGMPNCTRSTLLNFSFTVIYTLFYLLFSNLTQAVLLFTYPGVRKEHNMEKLMLLIVGGLLVKFWHHDRFVSWHMMCLPFRRTQCIPDFYGFYLSVNQCALVNIFFFVISLLESLFAVSVNLMESYPPLKSSYFCKGKITSIIIICREVLK